MRSKTKKAVILVGLPGSGKSTKALDIAQKALLESSVAYHSTDLFMMENGEYKWTREKLGWAHKSNQEAFQQSLDMKIGVVICDNTNIRARDRRFYIDAAQAAGYELQTIVVGSFDEDSCKLYAARNTHGVSLETIQEMARVYLAANQ